MQAKVNDAYYNLVIALLSCPSGIESITEKGSSTASCCAACLHCLLWVVESEEIWWVGSGKGLWKRRCWRRWLWLGRGGICKTSIAKGGPLFPFFPLFQACLPYSLPINCYNCNLFFTHCFAILLTGRVFLCLCFSSPLCGLRCFCHSILGTGILTAFLLIPPHNPLEDCLGKEAATLHLIASAKLMWKQCFCLFIFPVPSKSLYSFGEKRRTENAGAPYLNS